MDKISVRIEDKKHALLLEADCKKKTELELTTIDPKQQKALIEIFLVRDKMPRLLHQFHINNIKTGAKGIPLFNLQADFDGKNTLDLTLLLNGQKIQQKKILLNKETRQYWVFIPITAIIAAIIALLFFIGSYFLTNQGNPSKKSPSEIHQQEKKPKDRILKNKEKQKEIKASISSDKKDINLKKDNEEEAKILKNQEEMQKNAEEEKQRAEEQQKQLIQQKQEEKAALEKAIKLEKLLSALPLRIYFQPESALLLPQEKVKLQKLVPLLNNNPQAEIKLEGHCAIAGIKEIRMELSRQRAENVLNYLSMQGWKGTDKVKISAYGSSQPVSYAENQQHLNRRVIIQYQN